MAADRTRLSKRPNQGVRDDVGTPVILSPELPNRHVPASRVRGNRVLGFDEGSLEVQRLRTSWRQRFLRVSFGAAAAFTGSINQPTSWINHPAFDDVPVLLMEEGFDVVVESTLNAFGVGASWSWTTFPIRAYAHDVRRGTYTFPDSSYFLQRLGASQREKPAMLVFTLAAPLRKVLPPSDLLSPSDC